MNTPTILDLNGSEKISSLKNNYNLTNEQISEISRIEISRIEKISGKQLIATENDLETLNEITESEIVSQILLSLDKNYNLNCFKVSRLLSLNYLHLSRVVNKILPPESQEIERVCKLNKTCLNLDDFEAKRRSWSEKRASASEYDYAYSKKAEDLLKLYGDLELMSKCTSIEISEIINTLNCISVTDAKKLYSSARLEVSTRLDYIHGSVFAKFNNK